jgi:hypothetical protein
MKLQYDTVTGWVVAILRVGAPAPGYALIDPPDNFDGRLELWRVVDGQLVAQEPPARASGAPIGGVAWPGPST